MNWTLKFLPEAQKDFEQLAGNQKLLVAKALDKVCLLYTSPSPRDTR